jgi:acetyltransferase
MDRKLKEFEPIFYPKSIAVVGAGGEGSQKGGALYLRTLLAAGFPGEIYPVNPYESQISGLKAYPDVRSIPGAVDNVIIAVAAHLVPGVLDDCADKRVKVVQIFSAGFSEGGDEEGRRLEEEVVRRARKGGLFLIWGGCEEWGLAR